ncbi:hypothetical protein ACJ72_08587 [Emergomyces africanus]|uniref:Histidinol-phosphatase n=1 Tax=Emergomyces africanus TaxID=1955775 RepID=A0A1B7NJY6_9EURO|nr:hypothetical protein ACJ72_08587 [Emergomyces africanus]
MIKALKPPVIGHFDLIRLKSDDPERSFKQWPAVWEKILRNLDYVSEYGGILELNSASLRKGMTEPYPKAEICKVDSTLRILSLRGSHHYLELTINVGLQEFLARNGRFCLSDDSHGVDQVAFNYHRVLGFVEQVGISSLHNLEYCSGLSPSSSNFDHRFPNTRLNSVCLADLKQMDFWSLKNNK